jgi:ankyrin repeat protein
MAIALLSFSTLLNAMEEKEPKFEHWQALPAELQEHILSFVPDVNNYQDFQRLLTTDKQISALVNQPSLRKAFIHATLAGIIKQKPTTALKLLQEAVKNGNLELAKELILADLPKALSLKYDARELYSLLLDNAINNEHPAIAELLLSHGADANYRVENTTEKVPFYLKPFIVKAIDKNNADLVKLLIDHEAQVEPFYFGLSPMQLATQQRNKKIVELLLTKEAEPNLLNTALKIASENGDKEITEILIARGADTSHLSSPEGKEKREKREKLFEAVRHGDVAEITKLLDQGVEVDIRDELNQTPLIAAAKVDDKNLVEMLLQKGADVNAQGNGPINALLIAKNPEVVELLLQHGAELEVVNHHGDTALLSAIYSNEPKNVELLLQRGADCNVKDKDGKTPLQLAQARGNTEIIGILKSFCEATTSE